MKLQELKDALFTADEAAVLVSPRLLNRIIQEVHKLPTQFVSLPHRRSYVIDRHVLFRHIEQDELDLESDRLLPPTVILLARPSGDELLLTDRPSMLLRYWQRLFHSRVHMTLQMQRAQGELNAEELQSRIAAIGQTEFDEIRAVLDTDRYLLPPADDFVVYVEFAAVYLELRYFLPNLRAVYFPAISDFDAVDQLLARDIDADSLFRATRLPGAPDPVVRSDSKSDESHDFYWKLVRSAERASRAGNVVRAALLRTQASRVAPAALTLDTRAEAQAELQKLTARLQAVLKFSDTEASQWEIALPALLEKADQTHWSIEARLLYDLQQVCLDHEREIYALDLVEWVLSAGKRPIKRPLPSQRVVQITKHLRSASLRVSMTRLSDVDRQHLSKLLQTAVHQSEERMRARFRPVLSDAFLDVGLRPSNIPERTAFDKMVEELVDRIASVGFFTFSDLRDALSRNNLKLPDLADPQEFVRGDPLLRLDRRLSTSLDGVYRPSEIYLRTLTRFTSLTFGTKLGRKITRNFLLPFVGAFMLLAGLEHFVLPDHPPTVSGTVNRPVGVLEYLMSPSLYERDVPITLLPHLSPQPLSFVLSALPLLGLGFFFLGLLRSPALRRACSQVCKWVWRGLRRLFYDVPIYVLSIPALRRFLRSWLFQLISWYILKPLVVFALIWPWLPERDKDLTHAALLFLLIDLALNARLGHAASEAFIQAIYQFYDWLRAGLIEGLIRWAVRLSKQALDFLEYLLYSVDEWLRFRGGDGRVSLVVRTILGVVWYPISFCIRFYIVVLIEPAFHPIKLPISILAAKFILPFSVPLTLLLARPLIPLIGEGLAYSFAAFTVWWSGDLFGFLFWEVRENWRLYRANRPKVLTAVMIGHHGETMLQLLKPGFHSGTVPKLYAQLRRAERKASWTGIWKAARSYRQALHEVEDSVRVFLEREFVELLHQSRSWRSSPLRVGHILLAAQQIRIELGHANYPEDPFQIAFEQKAGWLVASIRASGWLKHLNTDQLRPLTTALAGLYKYAGVDLVREQILAALPPSVAGYDITESGLVLRPEQPDKAQTYPIHNSQLVIALQNGVVMPAEPEPPSQPERLIFAQVPLTWQCWVEFWQQDENGKGHPLVLPAGIALLPVTPEQIRDSRTVIREGPVEPPPSGRVEGL